MSKEPVPGSYGGRKQHIQTFNLVSMQLKTFLYPSVNDHNSDASFQPAATLSNSLRKGGSSSSNN